MNVLIVFNIAFIACAFANSIDDFRIIDSIHNEGPCSKEGGICTMASHCPKGKLAEKRDMCPSQKSLGVECCFGVSVKETRCRKHAGECITKCNTKNIYREATDCPEHTVCCIWTN